MELEMEMDKRLSIQDIYVSPSVARIDSVLRPLCRMFAIVGGFVLTALTLVTVVSVISRALFNAPIPGDFELVELGCAVAVGSFLPYCQIQEGNVIVDLFTAKASKGVIRFLGALGDLVFMAISGLICWRMVRGCLDLREYEEVTMVLEIPVWWAMPPLIASFALLTLTCAATALAQIIGQNGTRRQK